MALLSLCNQSYATWGAAFFAFKELLKSAGWTVPRSSDGTTMNTADVITHDGSGAGGMTNANAWFVLREPGGRREYLYQRSSTDNQWRMAYSASARFTGGTATGLPTATDLAWTCGSSGPFQIGATASSLKCSFVADTAPTAEGVYYFMILGVTTPAGAQNFVYGVDPLLTGTFPAADQDPLLVRAAFNTTNTPSAAGWHAYGTASQAWAAWTAYGYGPFPNGAATNVISGLEDMGPVAYGTGALWKGFGRRVRWKAVNKAWPNGGSTAEGYWAYLTWSAYLYSQSTEPVL